MNRRIWMVKNKIAGCFVIVFAGISLSACGVDTTGVEGSSVSGGSLDEQYAENISSEALQSILLYEEKNSSGGLDAQELKDLALLYGEADMHKRERDLLEQSYRLYKDEETLTLLSGITVNLQEEDASIQALAGQLYTNLTTEGYLNDAVSLLNDNGYFTSMMPKLSIGRRNYYLQQADGSTLYMEFGYKEDGSPYSSVFLTAADSSVIHLLLCDSSVYLLKTGLSGGSYQGAFESWLCLAGSGSIYHEQGFYEKGLCIGEYNCEVFFGSSATDLYSLWCNRTDFEFISYYGEFDSDGRTLVAQPGNAADGDVIYAYDASGKKYLSLSVEEAANPNEVLFDSNLWGLQSYPSFTAYEAISFDLTETEEGSVQIRIYDSNIEWFDGKMWHTIGSVADYEAADPFHTPMPESVPLPTAAPETENPDMGAGDDSGRGAGSTDAPPVQTQRPSDTAKPTQKPAQTPKPSDTAKPTQKPAQTPKPSGTVKPTQKPAQTPKPSGTVKPTQKPAQTEAPVTQTPTTAPTVAPPTTTKPTIAPPPTTKPPVTPPPATAPPVTPPPATAPPVTPPPVTQPPATNPGDGEDVEWTPDMM